MKRCVIFCAGEFTGLCHQPRQDDLLIAADGGICHLQSLGLQPQVILGDFDSLGHIPPGAEVFPVEKDDTDSMLAIKKGLALGCDTFLLYGAMDGNRPDHTVANYQALLYLAQRGARGFLTGTHQIATVLRDGCVTFPDRFRGHLSLFCLGPTAEQVCISGTKYTLDQGSLSADFPLGVSNSFLGRAATVSVGNGSLLMLWQRENGLIE